MPKNVSVYLPDELVKKLSEYPEINVSEICRQALENYYAKRVYEERIVVEELDSIKDRLTILERYIAKWKKGE